jgi:acetyl esterase/lipase
VPFIHELKEPDMPHRLQPGAVDPELLPFLNWRMGLLSHLGSYRFMLPKLRRVAQERGSKRLPLPAPAFKEQSVPGPTGAPDVPVYLVNSESGSSPRSAVLFIHGGGFISGSAKADLVFAQRIAAEHDCVVVSVEYRLAPETPFPGAREDIYQVLAWMHQNAQELGIDPARITIFGTSAGGGHAVSVSLVARDRGEFPIAAMVLVYPMLDDRTGSTGKVPSHMGRHLWTRRLNRLGWSCLLGMAPGGKRVPHGAVPARAERLDGLPPTFIGVGSIDLFAAEDAAFAKRLSAAGVPVDFVEIPGAFHGFDEAVPHAACSRAFKLAWNEALRKFLGTRAAATKTA